MHQVIWNVEFHVTVYAVISFSNLPDYPVVWDLFTEYLEGGCCRNWLVYGGEYRPSLFFKLFVGNAHFPKCELMH